MCIRDRLTLWGIVSSKEEQPATSEPSSEAASSEEMKPQNLVPNFVGIDYEQIKNNREYTSMYPVSYTHLHCKQQRPLHQRGQLRLPSGKQDVYKRQLYNHIKSFFVKEEM